MNNTEWVRERRKLRKLEGLCVICGARNAVEGHVSCQVCLDRQKKINKRNRGANDQKTV